MNRPETTRDKQLEDYILSEKGNNMSIIESSTYCKEQEFYQLSVINMWDFSTKAICFSKRDGHVTSYSLRHITRVTKDRSKFKVIEELNEEMISTLKNMGYSTK